MTTYVLMVFLFVPSHGLASTSGHFYTKAACEEARETILKQKLAHNNYMINAYCLPEGGEFDI